jgi:hypothetical protein
MNLHIVAVEGVIPKPRAFTSGARDLARDLPRGTRPGPKRYFSPDFVIHRTISTGFILI